MSRAEELILQTKRMMLMEPVLPFAEIKLSWVVKDEEGQEKEVDLLHTYEVLADKDYVGMQVVKKTCLPYEIDWNMLNAHADAVEEHVQEYYQIRIPIPMYVKVGEVIRLRYSYPNKDNGDYSHVADYEVKEETATIAVVGHQGVSTTQTEEQAKEAFTKLIDETFAL
jgi:hypothetical protein